VVAPYPHALFDLERRAGAHHVLPFAQARQHKRARGIDARGRLPDQASNELLLGDLLEHAQPRHALGAARGLGKRVERPLRHSDNRRATSAFGPKVG
jgi:hypothetical protein